MHFLKGGRQGKKPVCVLMYSSFCVHGFPVSGKGRKEEEKARQVSRVRARGTSQTPPLGRADCQANLGAGSAMPVCHYGAGFLILAMQC